LAALGTKQSWSYYRREFGVYRREVRTRRDLQSLLKVRLAQSKVGGIVCPRPTTVTVDLASLGVVSLRSHTTDISVLSELVVSGTYEPALAAIPGPVRTIVDLGSNTGLAARWFERAFPGAQVACVEPEPGNVDILRRNVAALTSPTVIAACVGGWRRRVTLDATRGEFMVTMSELDDEHVGTVDVVTMEDVLDQAGIGEVDLLKCDIEGAERELFASSQSWIGRIDTIVVECHGDYRAADLVADLADNGAVYEVWQLDPNPAFDNEVAVLQRVLKPTAPNELKRSAEPRG